jgi:hypothetical protein
MRIIKLHKVSEMDDGTINFQSCFFVGSDFCNFTLKDGVLKRWGKGINGYEFSVCNEPYEIYKFKIIDNGMEE